MAGELGDHGGDARSARDGGHAGPFLLEQVGYQHGLPLPRRRLAPTGSAATPSSRPVGQKGTGSSLLSDKHGTGRQLPWYRARGPIRRRHGHVPGSQPVKLDHLILNPADRRWAESVAATSARTEE